MAYLTTQQFIDQLRQTTDYTVNVSKLGNILDITDGFTRLLIDIRRDCTMVKQGAEQDDPSTTNGTLEIFSNDNRDDMQLLKLLSQYLPNGDKQPATSSPDEVPIGAMTDAQLYEQSRVHVYHLLVQTLKDADPYDLFDEIDWLTKVKSDASLKPQMDIQLDTQLARIRQQAGLMMVDNGHHWFDRENGNHETNQDVLKIIDQLF